MLATFVIGLREGVEAALIVGIIAAFLLKAGRRDALRQMWIGVGVALALCLAVGIGLQVAGSELPDRQQETLETFVALIAAAMVTFMIAWMRRHARGLKGELERGAASALAEGSTLALVGMAFFAVLREGFETAVFLVAAFQQSADATSGMIGAVLGIAASVALGWALFRGGVRINLSRFFRATGLVLVLVAAGLVAAAVHTAAEADLVTFLPSRAFDLSWLVSPGSVQASLLTGMFGLRPEPTVGEVVAWLAYAIPVGLFVTWPQRPGRARSVGAAPATAPAERSGVTA